MLFCFEISRPFCRKPFYKRTNISWNVGWLYFAIRIVSIDAVKLANALDHNWEV